MKNSNANPDPTSQECSSWTEILKCLEKFPPPRRMFDDLGEVHEEAWIFRGLRCRKYGLEPTIEREAKRVSISWAPLEELAKHEYRSRAPMHLERDRLPTDELTWLALMQHYDVPTRLLDFSYSPFVALYFAVRYQDEAAAPSSFARIWAIDAQAVNRKFHCVVDQAKQTAREKGVARQVSEEKPKSRRVSLAFDDMATERDVVVENLDDHRSSVEECLRASGAFRGELNRKGCVCAAQPPNFNRRLASQQGAFLVNCSEDRTLWDSLSTMISGQPDWSRVFDIDLGARQEIEKRLFQMNIHEQSLFPDLAGVAGVVRQRLRLQWP